MSLRTSRPWIVVLAGGDGRRLEGISRDRAGQLAPKQFCDFGAGATLLGRALQRAAGITTPDRVVMVVQESHQRWWQRERSAWSGCRVVAQPGNRGTATAVLQGLRLVLEHEPDPGLLVMPADHEVEDERAWARTLRLALAGAAARPRQLVLVGLTPGRDPDYGWIVHGARATDGTCAVASFVEKPPASEVAALLDRGALWSTFVFASRPAALLELYRRYAPELLDGVGARPVLGGAAFAELPRCDFSRDLLQRSPGHARVVRASPCGWTDLGTPARLARWRLQRDSERLAALAQWALAPAPA